MIEKHFEDVVTAKIDMQDALVKWVNANEDFYVLTGIKLSDMPKGGVPLGYADLLINIESLYNKYLKSKEDYEIEYNKCKKQLDKLNNRVHRLIIEYTYIDREIDRKSDKETLKILNKYHNIEITYPYFRRIKIIAKKEFENTLGNTL